jgi:hypothetical protein
VLGRPAPGATIEEYDPWELYSSARESNGKSQPPYQSLLELNLHQFDFERSRIIDRDRSSRLEPEQRAGIIRWCESYGLLGTLLHSSTRRAFSPKHTLGRHRIADFSATKGGRFIWVGGNWGLARYSQDGGGTWDRYFPSISENDKTTYEYPKPLTEEFWRIYAEPVEDFLEHAGWLIAALHRVASPPTFRSKGSEHGLGLETLNTLAGRVSPVLELNDDGSFRQGWGTNSLLASLATMAIFDIGGSQRVLRCETCGRHFVTPAYQAKYCSDTCRSTAQKRRSRAKKKRIAQASKSKGGSNG